MSPVAKKAVSSTGKTAKASKTAKSAKTVRAKKNAGVPEDLAVNAAAAASADEAAAEEAGQPAVKRNGAKKSLVVVESPAKAKTIEKYLGSDFIVTASMGHVRDLPPKRLGLEPDESFTPEYVTIEGKQKFLDRIKRESRTAKAVYLAPDPDREGEAIAWHIASVIKNQDIVYRATFNEITRTAVRAAIANPGKLNENLFNAQQARRILDRIVGYKISPLLWKKIQRGLSAGRVQSVAVRMICDREEQIAAFKPQEYWTIDGLVHRAADKSRPPKNFRVRLAKYKGKKIELGNERDARLAREEILKHPLHISGIVRREVSRDPAPPFITSSLAQEAARKLNFSAKRTMLIAQKLYEGLEIGGEAVGLITYMRTDSVRVANEAEQAARALIAGRYGKDFVPPSPPRYKQKKGAQDAHEAIRPTLLQHDPEAIRAVLEQEGAEFFKLYQLIWNRFLASQMAPAVFDATRVEAQAGDYMLTASGQAQKFAGFLAVYEEGQDDQATPEDQDPENEALPPGLVEGEELKYDPKELAANQHFTKPPGRYTEPTLIKELEKQGIGRPSTYAPIISVIQDKKYVERDERKRFFPTELGKITTELLKEHFEKILDVKFTALMEEQLDEVEAGNVNWETLLENFWREFKVNLEEAQVKMRNLKREIQKTDEKCEKCGHEMVIRWGRNGRFMACSNYPNCRNTRPYLEEGSSEAPANLVYARQKCGACGAEMVIKMGKWGRFAACTRYPECKTIEPVKTMVACPKPGCGGELVERTSKKGRIFYSCTNYKDKNCDYVSWEKPVDQACPKCKNYYLLQGRKGGQHFLKCPQEHCDFFEVLGAKTDSEQ